MQATITTFYHGTADSFSSFETGDGRHTNVHDENVTSGVFLTTERSDATFYAERAAENTGEAAIVLTCGLSEDCQLLDYEDVADQLEEDGHDDSSSELVDYALENGFGGIIFPRGGNVNTPGTVLVFDPAHIIIL